MTKTNSKQLAKLAFRFVLIIGIVNLFADMAYEGGRSIAGPFLGSLGASATVIGFVAGFGELLGYSLRSISVTSQIRPTVIGSSPSLVMPSTCSLCRRWRSPATGRL